MSKPSSSSMWFMLGVASLVVLLDQLSKQIVLNYLQVAQEVSVISGHLNLTLTFNKGAAFGILADMPDLYRELILGATTALALAAVVFFLFREYHSDRFAQTALAMVVGGALGNIIDRIRLGMVVDFIDAFHGEFHWPAFNVADSAICIGVVLLIFKKPSSMREL